MALDEPNAALKGRDDYVESDLDFSVSVKNCPVTYRRVPAVHADEGVERAGVARANMAVSTEAPLDDSEYQRKFKDYTVLQQHILFWDRDGDGAIYPWDTYIGFRELGFNLVFSLLATFIINVNFSYPTRLAHSILPDPFFRVYVDGIYKAKHGSDSGTYDPEGRFVPQFFENMFAKWDKGAKGALSTGELFDLMKGNRCAADPFGWGAALFEWGTTWLLLQKDGLVDKEDLRQLYDGSLFWRVREARRTGSWDKGWGLGGDGFIGGTKLIGSR
jgi:hypothetical protein